MGVTPSGDGIEWTLVEAVDVDQPLGLSRLESQHIAKGVRKRINKEHEAFGDNTAGGEHTPGGCNIMEIEDNTAALESDLTAGTHVGGGLVWCISTGTAYGVLFCATADGTIAVGDDVTVLKMHPDLQWAGGDVTWQGAHEFGGDVDITGDVSVGGALYVDASADFSGNVNITGDLTVKGSIKASVDFSLTGDMAVDGTANLTGDVACAADFSIDGTLTFQDAILTGDSTFTFDPIAGETGPIFKIFGDWSSRSNNTNYQARTDGFVVAYANVFGSGTAGRMEGLTDSGTPPTTVVARANADGGTNDEATITFPVKGDDYWKVTGGDTIRWLPFGDNT